MNSNKQIFRFRRLCIFLLGYLRQDKKIKNHCISFPFLSRSQACPPAPQETLDHKLLKLSLSIQKNQCPSSSFYSHGLIRLFKYLYQYLSTILKQMQASVEEKQNFFRYMEKGDKIREKLHQANLKMIFLNGQTKATKSTLFKYISGKKLKGVLYKGKTIYQDEQEIQEGKPPSLASITVVPAIRKLASNLWIVDNPGYKNNTDIHRVLGVSYMLKTMFDLGASIKFILVIPQEKITGTDQNYLTETLTCFLTQFKYELFTQQEQQTFLSSISFVISRAKQRKYSTQILNSLHEMLSDQKVQIENKQLFLKVIDNVVKNERYDFFNMAVKDKQPPQSKILENLQQGKKGWEFFDMANISSEKIVLPFKKDYQSLKKDHKDTFKQILDKRLNSFQVALEILINFTDTAKRNFNLENKIDYQECWEMMKSYNQQYDCYKKSLKDRLKEFSIDANNFPQEMKCLEFISHVEKISKFIRQIQFQEDTLKQQFENMQRQCRQLVLMYPHTFCKDKHQYQMMATFLFCFIRGFQEFQSLCQIAKDQTGQAYQDIQHMLNSLFGQNDFPELKAKFLQNISDKKWQQIQNSEELCHQMVSFIEKTVNDLDEQSKSFGEQNDNCIKAKNYRQQIQTIMAKMKTCQANQFILQGRVQEGFKIKANYLRISKFDNLQNNDDKTEIAKEMFLQMKEIFLQLSDLLMKISASKEEQVKLDMLKDCLFLYRKLKQPNKVSKIYDDILNITRDNYDEWETIKLQYAQHCFENFHFQKGLIVLQELLPITKRNEDTIKQAIRINLRNRNEKTTVYLENLNSTLSPSELVNMKNTLLKYVNN